MSRFRVSNLTKRELETAIEGANLTAIQLKIILELNREEKNDVGIMMDLCLSNNKYYAEKKTALCKLQRAAEG